MGHAAHATAGQARKHALVAGANRFVRCCIERNNALGAPEHIQKLVKRLQCPALARVKDKEARIVSRGWGMPGRVSVASCWALPSRVK